MHIFPGVYLEASFILLVRDSVPPHAAYHHLVARHEIGHDIFKLWHQSLLIDQVKVNQFICCNLYPYISFDKIKETSHIDGMIIFP